MDDGSIIEEERSVADAHPNGLRPFRRSDYIEKFKTLTDGLVTATETKKFLNLVQNLKSLKVRDINHINPKVKFNLSKYSKKKDTIF